MDIANALSSVAASLSGVQGSIPATDTQSTTDLQTAYALISGVQARYQGQ
jgi:hypothetical protein